MTEYHVDTCAVLARVGLDELAWIAEHRGGRLDCADPTVAQGVRFALRWIWRWSVVSIQHEDPVADLRNHFLLIEGHSAHALASLDGAAWLDLNLRSEAIVYHVGRILALADSLIHPAPIRAERVL